MFLEVNGASVATASNDDVYELVIAVAASESTIEAIALKHEQLYEPLA